MGSIDIIGDEEGGNWKEGLTPFDSGNKCAIMAVFSVFGIPKTYLDVGCGTGAMVNLARQIGVAAYGVDWLPHDEEWIHRRDLRKPFDMAIPCDLVTSIEFVEHIEPEYEGIISDTLVRHVAKGGRLVMTSAPPGQPGYNHFNCQPLKYWRDRMETRGLEYSNVDTRKLVEVWGHTFMATHWLENNLQVFYRP